MAAPVDEVQRGGRQMFPEGFSYLRRSNPVVASPDEEHGHGELAETIGDGFPLGRTGHADQPDRLLAVVNRGLHAIDQLVGGVPGVVKRQGCPFPDVRAVIAAKRRGAQLDASPL